MYIGLLGGSFNPVHIGHIRLAIEILEYPLLPLKRIDFIPCAIPPHKEIEGFLPFELRSAMLKSACTGINGLYVSDLEKERQGISYTWHTLKQYKKLEKDCKLLFMLGMENLEDLPNWYKGLEFPLLTDLGVVPRGDSDISLFKKIVLQHWSTAQILPTTYLQEVSEQNSDNYVAILPNGAKIFYMPLPRIDVSSSYIRKNWLNKRKINALMPDAALNVLEASQQKIYDVWKCFL